MSDAVTLMKYLEVKDVEQVYALLEKYEFPLHPNALQESMLFARQAFNEYMGSGGGK